jgi:hypothetical protein
MEQKDKIIKNKINEILQKEYPKSLILGIIVFDNGDTVTGFNFHSTGNQKKTITDLKIAMTVLNLELNNFFDRLKNTFFKD